ncbi:hypothetical protein [Streptomyces sp. PAN_FS17]|uniref:hypothetical protein n=1 Tax=Streptomyces sp. PAN_FS17 TaxID=1855351 RepID=UPI00089BA4DC|nr:hypothetical protein [Streptomyces sp. PAN_FS17]SEC64457.1 hypothetical protein SAMN05216482_4074 [Streptomyces sp. PAN_FS17]
MTAYSAEHERMAAVNEAWAAIIAAIAAGVFGVGGAYVGLVAGRRQTADQAHVEHGQWLRGQRQEAYLMFLDAWDAAMKDFQDFQGRWDGLVQEAREYGELPAPSETAESTVNEVWAAVRVPLERAELLGPKAVDLAVREITESFRQLREELVEQGDRESPFVDWERWNRALGKAGAARFTFQVAAMQTLRTPPSPGGEPRV